MRTTRLRPGPNIVRRVLSVTGEVAREHRALKRGMKRMPNPMPWDWAAPRLFPILAGPSFDAPGEAMVRARSEIGPMVQFGVDLGGVYTYVDEIVARRWECSPEQLMARALANLVVAAGRLEGSAVISGVMSGRSIRLLRDRPRWAASLVLLPDELFRLFGDHDQIIGVPTPSCLVSVPIDTPPHTVAEILIDFEHGTLRALWLDPFVIEDKQLLWTDDHDDAENDDAW